MKHLYFIKPIGMDGPIKVGASKCVEARVIELSAASPFRLELIAVTPNLGNLEYRLHAHLADARSHGEWFHPTDAVWAVITSVLNGTFDHEAFPRAKLPASSRRVNAKGAQGLRLALASA